VSADTVIISLSFGQSLKMNIRSGKKWVSKLTRYFHRNDDHLLTRPDFSNTEPTFPPPDFHSDHKQDFALLHRSEELEDLLNYRPPSKRPVIWSVFWILLGLVLIAPAGIARMESSARSVLIFFGLFPLIIGIYDLLKFESSPLERLPAIIIYKSKRPYTAPELMGGGVILLVCIETRDGQIRHYHVSLRLFKQIEQEDIGVAYVRDNRMIDFKKITLKRR
jgi:hypothetical protein